MNYDALFETIKGYVENDFPGTTWTDSTGTGTVTFTYRASDGYVLGNLATATIKINPKR